MELAKLLKGVSVRGCFLSSSHVVFFLLFHLSCGQTDLKATTSAPRAAQVMALDQFIGNWQEEKKEGFRHLADALGLTGEQRAFFENSTSHLSYSRNGDDWTISVGINGVPQVSTFTFKMGQTYDSQNIDGSPLKSVIRQEGARLVERHESTGQRQFVMDIVREINGDTMNATTTIGGVSMQTIYRKS